MAKEMEHKQIDGVITGVDEPQGVVKAIFAVFGNIDHGNDRIYPGAFAKTFSERGKKVRVLDNHNAHSTGDVIAKVKALRELGRSELPQDILALYPDAIGGAEIEAQFEPDKNLDPKSAAAFYRLKKGWISEWSFGYDALDVDYETINDKTTIRNIRTIRLYEVSPVLWGMNEATMTTDAKAADEKAVWSRSYINDLPDDSFLYVESGDKDEDGKTTPRTLRHLPYKDADGMIDLPHLRNAISRLSQADTGEAGGEKWLTEALREKLLAKARKLLEEETADKTVDNEPEVKAGAVLSKANAEKLRNALQTIADVLTNAGLMDTESDKTNGPTEETKEAPTEHNDSVGTQESEAPDIMIDLVKFETELNLLEVK